MSKKQPASTTEKIVYSYDKETREYTGEYQCQKDPMNEGAFLMPADATETPPPEVGENEAACFDGGKWVKKPDFRGSFTISPESQELFEVKELGAIPAGRYLLKREQVAEIYSGKKAKVEDGRLVLYTPPPTIEEQVAKLEEEIAATDWYIVRFAETGKEVPPEITARRAEIRGKITNLKATKEKEN